MKPEIVFKVADEDEIIESFISDLSKEEVNDKKMLRIPLSDKMKEKIVSKTMSKNEKGELKKYIRDFMAKDTENMNILIKKIEGYWNNQVSDFFFKEMEKSMGEKADRKFICCMTNLLPGTYFDDNLITIPYYDNYREKTDDENLSFVSFILAEEVLHLIYYNAWRKIFKNNWSLRRIIRELWFKNDMKLWKIGEIIPQYLLVENEEFKRFGWNSIDRVKAYPWINDFRAVSDRLWKSRKNFADFVIKMHKEYDCLPPRSI